jgi:hypothetical protein
MVTLETRHGGVLWLASMLIAGCGAQASNTQPAQPAASQPPAAAAKQPHPTTLTHDQAMRDARQLVRLVEESHPDPYTVMGGKIAFKRKAQELLSSLATGESATSEFGQRLQDFLAGLGDGHTFVRVAESVSSGDDAPKPTVPVKFAVYDAGLVVTGFDTDEMKGTLGYKLLSVSGRTLSDLTQELRKHTSVENTYHALAKLKEALTCKNRLASRLPTLRDAPSLAFELEAPDGRRTTRTLSHADSLPAPESWAQPPQRWASIKDCQGPYCFKLFEKESVAYFRVADIMGREAYEMAIRYGWGEPMTWMERYYAKQNQPMPATQDEALAGIPSFYEAGEKVLLAMRAKNIKHLVIDLRDNTGGVTPTVIPFLYALYGDNYFAKPPPGEFVTVMSAIYLTKFHATIEQAREDRANPYLAVGDYLFDSEQGGNAVELRQKQLAEYTGKDMSFAAALAKLDGKPIYEPQSVTVVCDEWTYSAGFHFAFFLKNLGAKLVGVPPAQAPNTFMEVTPFTLSESGLEGSISNSAQIFLRDDPRGDVLKTDLPLDYGAYRKYGFDEDSAVRYAMDFITGKSAPASK